jgi:hypothetical protein
LQEQDTVVKAITTGKVRVIKVLNNLNFMGDILFLLCSVLCVL